MFSRQDAERIGDVVASVARTEIMPRFAGLIGNGVRTKESAFDVVSDADEAAEAAISAALLELFPTATIIGEEATERDPGLLEGVAIADLAFLIDPIDGTKNFVSGLPLFGTMIAGLVRGEVVFGAIHDPVRRDTAFALSGGGAWLQGDNQPEIGLRVAEPVPASEMEAVVGTNFLPEPMRSIVSRNLSRVALNFWLRCAAHEYRMAAAGHCHLLLYNRLKPWDHAAGWLLHKEAGGYSAHFDGTSYRAAHMTGGLICAPDETSWANARAALIEP